MRLIKKIEKHEMLRRWAIAEVHTEYLTSINAEYPQEVLRLLHSNDFELELEGINKSLKMHHLSLVDCLPSDVSWFLAGCEINQSTFNQLYTLPVPDMAKISGNTYKVSDAARIIQQDPLLDPRITGICNTFKSNQEQIQLSGITVLAKSLDGPYTIIEGNGRFISLYSILFLDENRVVFSEELEIVIGLSEAEFEIYFKYID